MFGLLFIVGNVLAQLINPSPVTVTVYDNGVEIFTTSSLDVSVPTHVVAAIKRGTVLISVSNPKAQNVYVADGGENPRYVMYQPGIHYFLPKVAGDSSGFRVVVADNVDQKYNGESAQQQIATSIAAGTAYSTPEFMITFTPSPTFVPTNTPVVPGNAIQMTLTAMP